MIEAQISPSHWLVATTKHYSDAFVMADYFSKQGEKCLEISAIGQRGLLIFELKEMLSTLDQKSVNEKFGIELDRVVVIENLDANIIKAYLSLENSSVEKFLLFLEFDFLGDALVTAQKAVAQGFKIVDFRFIRSSNHVVHLIFTGMDEILAESLRKMHSNGHSKMLINPTMEIKKFFEIFPN